MEPGEGNLENGTWRMELGEWNLKDGTWRRENEERFIKMMVERIATAKKPKPILDAAFQKETFSCGVGFTTLRSATATAFI